MNAVPLEGPAAIDATRAAKASVARSRIAYLESLANPTKAQREQLATERATLTRTQWEQLALELNVPDADGKLSP
jgi:hypothetical protein